MITRMKQYVKSLFLMTLAALSLVSCEKPDNSEGQETKVAERKFIELTKTQSEYVKKNNKVAFTLFKDIMESHNGKGFVFSPLSIEYALSLVANGANGQTQDEILSFLRFSKDDIRGLNDYYKLLFTELPALDKSIKFSLANAIVVNSDRFSLNDTYVQNMSNYYDALIKGFPLKHKGECEKAFAFINKWAEEETNGLIKNFLDGEVTERDLAYILNALYFKGNWSAKVSFKTKDTKTGTFTKNDGVKVKVPFMHQRSKISGMVTQEYKTIWLPYGSGAFTMQIILPENGISVEGLVPSLLRDEKGIVVMDFDVNLSLPKFSTDIIRTDLGSNILPKYIPTSFNPYLADFKGIGHGIESDEFCIGECYQKAKIEVNEKGTEMAAVTAIGYGVTSPGVIKKPEILEFNADHPFIYIIREESTKAIISMGVYNGE